MDCTKTKVSWQTEKSDINAQLLELASGQTDDDSCFDAVPEPWDEPRQELHRLANEIITDGPNVDYLMQQVKKLESKEKQSLKITSASQLIVDHPHLHDAVVEGYLRAVRGNHEPDSAPQVR